MTPGQSGPVLTPQQHTDKGTVAHVGPVRVWICIILALGAPLVSFAFGLRVGIDYRTFRMLFELGKRDALVTAAKYELGLQKRHSNELQDLWILLSVMPGKRNGYYVDVGSNDGVKGSNSKLLDDMGWRGVCIDPLASNMTSRTCQLFRQPVFSVSGKKISFRAASRGDGGIVETLGITGRQPDVQRAPLVDLVTVTLDEILEKAKAPNHIDFMSIDIEGAEFEALRGLSLDKYQVEAFAIEHNNEQPKRDNIRQLLESKGYTRVRSWFHDDWYVRHNLPYQFHLDFTLK